jgi:hypothetical protein
MQAAGFSISKDRDSLSRIIKQTQRSQYESASRLKRNRISPIRTRPNGRSEVNIYHTERTPAASGEPSLIKMPEELNNYGYI